MATLAEVQEMVEILSGNEVAVDAMVDHELIINVAILRGLATHATEARMQAIVDKQNFDVDTILKNIRIGLPSLFPRE